MSNKMPELQPPSVRKQVKRLEFLCNVAKNLAEYTFYVELFKAHFRLLRHGLNDIVKVR